MLWWRLNSLLFEMLKRNCRKYVIVEQFGNFVFQVGGQRIFWRSRPAMCPQDLQGPICSQSFLWSSFLDLDSWRSFHNWPNFVTELTNENCYRVKMLQVLLEYFKNLTKSTQEDEIKCSMLPLARSPWRLNFSSGDWYFKPAGPNDE